MTQAIRTHTHPTRPTTADRELPRPVRPEYVSLEVAAGYTSLCSRTVRRAIAAGELTGYRFGKALRVKVKDLDAWADSKAMPNARTTGTSRRR